MKKSTLNFLIDALMFICMSAVTGIGFLIKFTLIPGQERWVKYGSNVELTLLGLDRHQWGKIHLLIALFLIVLLVFHIILHWNIVSFSFNKIVKAKVIKIISTLLFILISAFLIFFPFLVHPEVTEIEQGHGRQMTITNENQIQKNDTLFGQKRNKQNVDTHQDKHQHFNSAIEVKGFMTLAEISEKYNVPLEVIKEKLNIPKTVSEDQRLSLLKKKYDFSMNEVKKIIEEYNTRIKQN